MKIIILSLIILLSKIYVNAQEKNCEWINVISPETYDVCNHNPWILVFEDNFDNDSLDLTKWTYGSGDRLRYCNNEQQCYTNGDNIEISNGTLKLIAKRDTIYTRVVNWLPDDEVFICNGNNKGQNKRYFYYTSANIETVKNFHYGKFEARVKIPKGKGFWPAFWLYGENPYYNEIDIFEFWNEKDTLNRSKVHHMNVHHDYDGDGKRKMCSSKYIGEDFSQDFHIFTLIWDTDKIQWYVDDSLKRIDYRYLKIDDKNNICTIDLWHEYLENTIFTKQPMHVIFNLAIEGTDNNESPDVSTIFPSQMEIDWIRCYQRSLNTSDSITNTNQYTLFNKNYKLIKGTNININCGEVVEHEKLNYEANDIQIYSNSNECKIIVDFGSKDYMDFEIMLSDFKGNYIKSYKDLNSSVYTIDMSNNIKTFNLLYLLNKKDKTITTHKTVF